MNIYEDVKEALNLKYHPVAFKLIFEKNYRPEIEQKFEAPSDFKRFCLFIKEAGEGRALRLKESNSSCLMIDKKSEIPSPTKLELNIQLDFRGLKYFLLFPKDLYEEEDFDGLILVLNPKNAMKIIKAYVELFNKPLKLNCGVRSGVCSEITAYVTKRQDVNFSFLCSGARRFADYDECELLCGIPAKMTDELLGKIVGK